MLLGSLGTQVKPLPLFRKPLKTLIESVQPKSDIGRLPQAYCNLQNQTKQKSVDHGNMLMICKIEICKLQNGNMLLICKIEICKLRLLTV